jgi:WD40 repeat protein
MLTEVYTNSGSTDKTVKFWDLETFQLIGSSGPEVYCSIINLAHLMCSGITIKLC